MVLRHGAAGRNAVRFAMVYIAEAHAKDEWCVARHPRPPPTNRLTRAGRCLRPISEARREFDQHKTLPERVAAARALLSDYELAPELSAECYADPIANPFESAYASWPFRFWVLGNSAVLLKAMPRDAMYELGEIEAHLEGY